jgi:hypothetical protein
MNKNELNELVKGGESVFFAAINVMLACSLGLVTLAIILIIK